MGEEHASSSVCLEPLVASCAARVQLQPARSFLHAQQHKALLRHEISTAALELSLCPRSNAEFLDFVRDGGYRSKQWWSEEGWRWRTFRNAKWPTFWVPEGPQGEPGAAWALPLATPFKAVQSSTPAGAPPPALHHPAPPAPLALLLTVLFTLPHPALPHPAATPPPPLTHHCSSKHPAGLHRYKLRLVFEVVDLPLALPAVVNHHEARAYANWLSAKQVGRPASAL